MSETTDTTDLGFGEVRAILEDYFAGGELDDALDGTRPDTLFEAIAEDERARNLFNELAMADRALGGALDGEADADLLEATGDFERRLGDAAFESALDEMLAEEAAEANETEETDGAADVIPLFNSGRTGALVAAAVALLAAGTLLYIQRTSGPTGGDAGDFNARSAATAPEPGRFDAPDLRVFCAERQQGEVSFRDRAQTPGDGLRCPRDAELKLAYRNRSSQLTHAAFFGVDRSGTLYWYGPTPAAPEPVAVQSADELLPVGETIRLAVNHEPGDIRVHAVFSTRPIGFEQLAADLKSRDRGALFEGERVELSGAPGAATSTTFTVVEETNR
jgi:hypothetical protein